MDELNKKVIEWAIERDLISIENAPRQLLKVYEELGELSGALLKQNNDGIVDGIGDAFVTLIILSAQLGYTPEHCLKSAYNEIKNRTGETKNGIFVKET